jgi:hypothetical protein
MDMGALGRFEPSLSAVKIPRCAGCGTANPRALSKCESCGAEQPRASETRFETSIAVNIDGLFPWHARALLAIGALLKRLALRFKGD